MLTKIRFNKLYETFDYDINLKDGGVTIITGPNGFGKSTILNCIEALYSFDIFFFDKLQFSRIYYFSDTYEKPLVIEKSDKLINIDNFPINVEDLERYILGKVRIPFYIKLDKQRWIDRRTDETISKDEAVKKIISEESDILADYFKDYKLEALKDKCKSYTGSIKFIKEQRLLKERPSGRFETQTVNVVEELPDQFMKIINQVSNEYSSKSNNLDSTYPTRLFETKIGITKEEYDESLKRINEKLEKINKYNISDIAELNPIAFEEEHSKALKIYFDDFDSKYKVYEEFIVQLDLFTGIINSRFKFKQIKISREEGIVVYKKDTNKLLSLSELSSGEKQELILFYELIFESDKNIHLLIDEPEISLHIAWQLAFMDDLLKIAKNKDFKVTVATHSPQIINNHWDMQIDLGELYGN